MAVPAAFRTRAERSGRQRVIWYIEIEGLRRRYATRLPDWNPADTSTNRTMQSYICEIPDVSAQSCKPLNGSSTPHGFDIELADIGGALTSVFSTHDTSNRNDTMLASACTASATTIYVDDSSGFTTPCDVYCERETMRATGTTSGGGITVQRGMYGSQAVAHAITNTSGTSKQVIVSDRPRYMVSRIVSLCENRVGLTESDSVKIHGVLDKLSTDGARWKLSAEGFMRQIDRKVGEDAPQTYLVKKLLGKNKNSINRYVGKAWAMYVNDLTGFPATGSVMVDSEIIKYVEVRDQDATYPNDKLLVILPQDDNDLDPVDALLGNRGRLYFDCMASSSLLDIIDQISVFVDGEHEPYIDNWKLNEFIEKHDSNATVKYVLGYDAFTAGTDPISIVLQFLLSVDGDGSNHATYDTLPKGWGAGLPSSWVDVAGMEALKLKLSSQDWDMKFYLTEPIELKDWLEKNVLRPALLFLREQWDGKIGIARVYTRAEAETIGSDLDIDESLLTEMPEVDLGQQPMQTIKIACNHYPPTGTRYGSMTVQMGDSADIYRGDGSNLEITCDTLYSPQLSNPRLWLPVEIGDLPKFIGAFVQPIVDRYAFDPPPKVTISIPYSRLNRVPVGSIIRLTSSSIANPKTASRGMTLEYFQVVKCKPDTQNAKVDLDLWMIGIHDDNYRRIAPSAVVVGYSSGTYTIECDSNTYTDSDDVAQFSGGDKVVLLSAAYNELTPAEVMTVDSRGSSTIVLTGAPTANPTAGCIVTTAPYDSCVAAQTTEWAYCAGSDDLLGSGGDEGTIRK